MSDKPTLDNVESFLLEVEAQWQNVPEWVIFDDEDGQGIVRTKIGKIVAETMTGDGSHVDAVRIVCAREGIPRLVAIVREQAIERDDMLERHEELRARNRELKHQKASLIDSCEAIEKERDTACDRIAKLEALLRQAKDLARDAVMLNSQFVRERHSLDARLDALLEAKDGAT